MASGLEHLLEEGVITEVIARLQSGKEAEVYVVRFGGRVVAAKVYKDRDFRSFKNNASYMEGRTMRSSRSQRAIDRGSRFGKATAEDAWKSAEADALYKLHAAEVRVPAPVLFLDGVLLMELVLDADGEPARRLIDTELTVEQANAGYHDMLAQLVRILSCDLIHGDLSPYNVLWAAAGPTVIDFPQIVSASHNSSSERFFLRDAENVLGHFVRVDRSLAARRSDAWEIWRAYVGRELTPEFRPSGRSRPPVRVVAPQPAPRPHSGPPPQRHAAPPPRRAHDAGPPPPPQRPMQAPPPQRPMQAPDRRPHPVPGPRPVRAVVPPPSRPLAGPPQQASHDRSHGRPHDRQARPARPHKDGPRAVEVIMRRQPASFTTPAESIAPPPREPSRPSTTASTVAPAPGTNRTDSSLPVGRRKRRRRRHG